MSKKSRVLAGLTVALVGTFSGARLAHAQEVPAPVEHTAQTIQSEGRAIMAWVYPSVTLMKVGGCAWNQTRQGHDLTCPFFYTDDGDPGVRRLRFHLNAAGLITSIADAGGTAVWPPFATMRLMKEVLAEAAREALDKSARVDPDARAVLSLLAGSPEPEDILALMLDIKIAGQG